MNQIFAFSSSNPKLTAHALYPYRNLLSQPSDKGPFSWGFAFSKPSEEIILKRRPFHLEGFNIFEPIEHNHICCGIGNILRTEQSVQIQNTMPFRYRNWFFTMIGQSNRSNQIKEWLLSTLPGFLKRNLYGKTEKEHVFALFLSYLYDTSIINSVDFSRDILGSALARTWETWNLFLNDAGEDSCKTVMSVTNGQLIMSLASHENIAGYHYTEGIHQNCAYCRSHSSDGDSPTTHPDLQTLFFLGDLETPPREFGLTPLPSNDILLFEKGQLRFISK